jgi:RNA polymerase sigma factor (sigma-70 family)
MSNSVADRTGSEPYGLMWALGRVAQEKDVQAWAILVAMAGPDIHRLAIRLTGDRALAEDIVQETLMLVRDHATRFVARVGESDDVARRWILGVATNTSLLIGRRHRRQIYRDSRAGLVATQTATPVPDPSQLAEVTDESEMLRRELAELPLVYGQALTLHYFAGQDYPELASHLRVSVNTVRSRVHRGLKALRERLDRCGVSLSIMALTGLLSNLGAAPVATVALPATTLGIISSSAVPTTAFVGASAVSTGGFLIATVLSTVLAATVAVMGISLGWFSSSASPLGSSTASAETLLVVQKSEPVVRPDAGILLKPFIMVVNTDPAKLPKEGYRLAQSLKGRSASGSNQFMLPLNPEYAYDFTVNWGDGSTQVIQKVIKPGLSGLVDKENFKGTGALADWFITHIYPKAGIYTLQITPHGSDGFPALYFNNEGDCEKLREIVQWGGSTWGSMDSAFRGCAYLSITAADSATARTEKVSNYRYAWDGCSGLTSFPLLNTAAGTDFLCAWRDCSGLTSFPLLNTAAGKKFNAAWSGCSGLTSFPLLNTAAGTKFLSAWMGCSGLTSFPLLNTAAGTDFGGAWIRCSGLTSFPLLNTTAGTNFWCAWADCKGLTSFPLLNTKAGMNFDRAWTDCSGLTSFPLLNTAAGTNFYGAWYGCSGLTSFPLLNTAAGTNFEAAWYGCSGLTNFPLLNTTAGTNFGYAWAHCRSLTSFPLLNTAAGTNFEAAWGSCSGLTNFPLLNTTAGTNFTSAWHDCVNLKEFPLLNFENMKEGESCFSGVTLASASYGDLLAHTAAVNAIAKVTFDGGFSKTSSLIGMQAREKLIKNLGWTIYDGDHPKPKSDNKNNQTVEPQPKPEEANVF